MSEGVGLRVRSVVRGSPPNPRAGGVGVGGATDPRASITRRARGLRRPSRVSITAGVGRGVRGGETRVRDGRETHVLLLPVLGVAGVEPRVGDLGRGVGVRCEEERARGRVQPRRSRGRAGATTRGKRGRGGRAGGRRGEATRARDGGRERRDAPIGRGRENIRAAPRGRRGKRATRDAPAKPRVAWVTGPLGTALRRRARGAAARRIPDICACRARDDEWGTRTPEREKRRRVQERTRRMRRRAGTESGQDPASRRPGWNGRVERLGFTGLPRWQHCGRVPLRDRALPSLARPLGDQAPTTSAGMLATQTGLAGARAAALGGCASRFPRAVLPRRRRWNPRAIRRFPWCLSKRRAGF